VLQRSILAYCNISSEACRFNQQLRVPVCHSFFCGTGRRVQHRLLHGARMGCHSESFTRYCKRGSALRLQIPTSDEGVRHMSSLARTK
jgi:hypothetical protein